MMFLQGQSNLHQLMATNMQIFRGSAPALQIASPAPPHTFTSHMPRGQQFNSYKTDIIA